MTNGHGKGRAREEEEEEVEEDVAPPKKKAKNGVKNKQLDAVKNGSKSTTAQTSRASSVVSNGVSPKTKGKGKKK
ncbi:MAG: hypothetical protein Q9192_008839 [Flavoplaca navasiana]